MIRHLPALFLILATGCASAPAKPEGPLDRLASKSNAYTSFHLRGEIRDGKQSVPVEMAYRAPDRAILKYGTVATTILAGGVSQHFLRGTTYSIGYAAAIRELRQRYGGLPIGPAPEPVFALGDGVRAQLSLGRLGARLGWLDELRGYKAEGNLYRLGQTEIELREDGFIARTSIAGTSFVLRDVAINTALPDALFALPSRDGLQDASERLKPDLLRGLEEACRRWILETSLTDETMDTILRVDLVRKYDPEKMAELLRESVRKGLAAFHVLQPDARPEVVRDKLLIDRARAMGNLETLEEEIQKEFEKVLDGCFRGMAVPPPQKDILEASRRWHLAVKRQVDEQIRRRLQAVFDEAHKE